MASFEYRRALPDVLDVIHKKTVVAHLSSIGVNANVDMSWAEIETCADEKKVYETHAVAALHYQGLHDIGRMAGVSQNYVRSSLTADAVNGAKSNPPGTYLGSKSRFIILSGPDPRGPEVNLYAGSGDAPPYALHGEDIEYVREHDPKVRETESKDMWALLGAVERAFGKEAIDYIDEATAQAVIFALQNDEPTVGRL